MDKQTPPSGTGHTAVADLPVTVSLEVRAAQWLAVLDSDSPSRQEIKAFRSWISQSPAHRAEFERLAAIWHRLDLLAQIQLPRRPAAVGETVADTAARPRKRRVWSWAAGLAVVTLMAVCLSLLRPPATIIHQTGVGEQSTIRLADGSRVLLNTNSRLLVSFSKNLRQLTLEAGEALFEVAHDVQRPFEVNAGEGTIRAVGTAFNVRLQQQQVEVLVTDGVVEIKRPATPSGFAAPATGDTGAAVRVGAHNIAVLPTGLRKDIEVAPMNVRSRETRLAWRHGVLSFDDEPLQNVVNEMSRYTPERFVIIEESLRQMKFSGIFKLGDTESMCEALRLGFGIQAQKVTDNFIWLSRADSD